MKLIHLKALNFMRFQRMDLQFNDDGLYCIEGANESGKSTIGHLIFFALCGVGSRGEKAENLINWEQSQMKVKITFKHGNSTYQILRQIDRDGSNFSKCAKGSKVMAQGNTPIQDFLTCELGYRPTDLHRSFITTHRIIQELVHHPSVDHLDYMIGLDPLKAIAEKAQADSKIEEEGCQKLLNQEKRLKEDLHSLGYSQELEQVDVDRKNDEEDKILNVEGDLKLQELEASSQGQLLQGLGSEIQRLPKDIDEDLDQHPPTLEKMLEWMKASSWKKNKEELASSVKERLENTLAFCEARGKVLNSLESDLLALKSKIGDSSGKEPTDPDSLSGKIETFKKKQDKASKRSGRYVTLTFFIGLLMSALVLAVIFLSPLRDNLSDSWVRPVLEDHLQNPWLKEVNTAFRPNSETGLPNHPLPFSLAGGSILIFLTFLILTIKSFSKVGRERKKGHALKEEREALRKRYQNLLSADIKVTVEWIRVIEEDGEESLQAQVAALKENFSDMDVENFNCNPAIAALRRDLEKLKNELEYDLQKGRQLREDLESRLSDHHDAKKKLEDALAEWAQKKEQHIKLEGELDSLHAEISEKKKSFATQNNLSTLAKGCSDGVRERVRRELTQRFKKLMPIITAERYQSIRFDDNFQLEVFSEDRGDFVPLHHLSSGTNDLFQLVYQVTLLQAFMESRGHDGHFLFLDEPLLAVDNVRYQRLADLLPQLSKGMGQIFLCRPPQNQNQALRLKTDLESYELVADFTNQTSSSSSS